MAMKGVSNVEGLIERAWAGFGKRFIYRPAALWLGWTFIAGVAGIFFFFLLLWRVWTTFGLPLTEPLILTLAPYILAVVIPLAFFLAYAGLQYTVARGFFIAIGDAGLYHVNQQTPLAVTVTRDEFDATEDPDFSKDPRYFGKLVRRNKVVMWGRLGGVKNWPGWDGGKRDGYWAVVYDFWDEIESAVVRGRRYTPDELDGLSRQVPGYRLGTLMVLPYEAWPVALDEVPEELSLAIRSDPEYRMSSRIWTMEDLLSSRIAMGSAVPSNTLVRLWSTERTNRVLRDRLMEVTMQLAMVRGMQEEAMSGQPMAPPAGGQSGFLRP